jgi:hypothetical protein
LITQDLDFSAGDVSPPAIMQGVLLVRLPDAEHEQWRISDYLVAWLSTSDASTWERCFVVGTPNKVRVRRPPKT